LQRTLADGTPHLTCTDGLQRIHAEWPEWFRKPMLYPLSYGGVKVQVRTYFWRFAPAFEIPLPGA
jgi:hypothetical protein